MSGPADWPQDRLHHFWELQHRAMKVDLRLTADADGTLHLRGKDRDDAVKDLDTADGLIAIAEGVRLG